MAADGNSLAGWIAASSSGATVLLFGYMIKGLRKFMNQHEYLMKGMEFLLDQQPKRRTMVRQHQEMWRYHKAAKKKV